MSVKKPYLVRPKVITLLILFLIISNFMLINRIKCKNYFETKPIINNPIVVYSYDQLEIIDNYAFTFGGLGAPIEILDISNINEPVKVTTTYTTPVLYFEERNDYFYFLKSNLTGLIIEIYNATNLPEFQYVSEFLVHNATDENTSDFICYNFYIFNDLLFLPKIDFTITTWDQYEIDVFNISKINEMSKIGSFNTTGHIEDMCYDDSSAYLIHNYYNIQQNNRLEIFNLSNTSNIQIDCNISLGYLPDRIQLFNNKLVIGSHEKGLLIYEKPQNDILIILEQINFNYQLTYFKIQNQNAYLLFSDRIIIVDLSSIENYFILADEVIRFQGDGSFNDLEIEEDVIIATRKVFEYNAPLMIFDCSNINEPKLVYPVEVFAKEYNAWMLTIIFGFVMPPILIIGIIIFLVIKNRKIRKKEE